MFFCQIISCFGMNSKNVLFVLMFCPNNMSFLSSLSFLCHFIPKTRLFLRQNTKRTRTERTVSPTHPLVQLFNVYIYASEQGTTLRVSHTSNFVFVYILPNTSI